MLDDVALARTSLAGSDLIHVERLATSWRPLADLTFADLLLLVPIAGEEGHRFVVLGQVRPVTGQTNYPQDLVGNVVDEVERPLLARCWRSGDFLFAALHRAGFASQPESVHAGDGLRLRDAYVAAAVRCAPPANKPTPAERDECRPFLVRELQLLTRVRVVVALGSFGYDAAWSVLGGTGRRPRFAHGVEVQCDGVTLLGAFHPSQQNTFTGKLTPAMLDAVLDRARQLSQATSSPTA